MGEQAEGTNANLAPNNERNVGYIERLAVDKTAEGELTVRQQ